MSLSSHLSVFFEFPFSLSFPFSFSFPFSLNFPFSMSFPFSLTFLFSLTFHSVINCRKKKIEQEKFALFLFPSFHFWFLSLFHFFSHICLFLLLFLLFLRCTFYYSFIFWFSYLSFCLLYIHFLYYFLFSLFPSLFWLFITPSPSSYFSTSSNLSSPPLLPPSSLLSHAPSPEA